MEIDYVRPEGMHVNPAFTQALILPAAARLMLIGGQNAVDGSGVIVGKGDVGAQAAKAIDNLKLCLASRGLGLEHLVKMTIYLVAGQEIRPAFGAWMARWGNRTNPPIVTGLYVTALANPDFLIEIEATAIVP
jgi:enamine deaminase RidA (YjgF/YER057c/UK114 family)